MDKKNLHAGHRNRIRDRVRKEGLHNFQDYQVLEYALSFVIPYKDTNPIAHELINKFHSLGGVLEADEEEIAQVKGMGEVSAHFLTSIIKIYSFYEKEKVNRSGEIFSPKHSYDYVKGLFKGKIVEELYLISLLPNNKIVRCELVTSGDSSQAKVTIRKITDMILRNKVNNVIIAHNHPYGNPEPSPDDDKLTKALVTSLAINDSYLIDHIIVCDNGYYSYRNDGKIDEYRKEVIELINGKVAQNEATYEVDYDQE